MDSRAFLSNTGLKLEVMHRKSAVILALHQSQENKVSYNYLFQFTPKDFKVLLAYIETAANDAWSDLKIREADSTSSDYAEYYDAEFDSNGYLSIKGSGLSIERPSLNSNRLYQFNKRRMESFIHDIRKLTTS